jgi:thymidine phosphorylase
MGISIEVIATDGSRPIGRGVGPLLETQDVLAVLDNRRDAPRDLLDRSVTLAGRLLEVDPRIQGGRGEARARELIASGAARRKLDEIVDAQGPSPLKATPGSLAHEIPAMRPGVITAIDCQRVAVLARLAGAPTDAGAGLRLLKDVGETVRAGDPLYRIHGAERSDFGFAVEAAQEDSGFTLAPA